MAARFLTAREVQGKLYANAAAQDSRDLSSEEEEEEKEKEEHGEDEPRGKGVRGEEDALEYGDEGPGVRGQRSRGGGRGAGFARTTGRTERAERAPRDAGPQPGARGTEFGRRTRG
ncbi:hypothetical protein CesoFtcFv8_013405 [Champsocephalus esox]|uniref:Uncharacterized protein n=1 Tax=Champsocephalus esox TaxID=159716 RepID=A0AAN8GTN9_9TELE|nr:hypothetical protein CesoFtcFv8_013405 [Champsocephalus esox]